MHPTHRISYGRTRRRRAHQAIEVETFTTCPVSGEAKQHHRVSKESGYVRPGLVISVPKLGIGPKKD